MAPLDVLRRLPLFALFGKDWLTEWLAQGEVVTMALGETLCQAGVWGRWLMLVEEGRVRVLRQAGSGREVSLASLGPGEVFGEYALLSPGCAAGHVPRGSGGASAAASSASPAAGAGQPAGSAGRSACLAEAARRGAVPA